MKFHARVFKIIKQNNTVKGGKFIFLRGNRLQYYYYIIILICKGKLLYI